MRYNNYFFLVLDIETSTLFNDLQEPTAVWLTYGYCILYDRNATQLEKCYFREFAQLEKWYKKITQRFARTKLICFVHNLGYEFDFLIKNLSKSEKILTNSTHAVISATLEAFPQIEFRCTLRLTMKSLRELGKLTGHNKLHSDYRFITPLDDVTEEEKIYCEEDCNVVADYVAKFLLKEFGTFQNLPLTKTGRVRKTYNQFYTEYVKNELNGEKPIWDLQPPEDCYQAELDAFAGGVVISNPMFTGIVLNNVDSHDISSSYPFAQLSEEYPYTISRDYNPTKEMLKERFWIAKIKFKNIHSKFTWGWLSVSKMNDYSAFKSEFFNGKLLYAEYIIRTITNVDYDIISKTYKFDDIEVLEFYHMEQYGELPKPYIQTIEKYAVEKNRMKIIASNSKPSDDNYFKIQVEYMNAKGDFNSIYGMSVQKLLNDEYDIDDNFEWKKRPQKYIDQQKHIRRNFLFGVYVTAYARRNLIYAILKNCPYTLVYTDTDSIKKIGGQSFVDTNKQLPEKYRDHPDLKKLGRFELDAHYEKFVTYGAKKYAYKIANDDTIYLTVAGLPKFKADSKTEIYYNNKRKEKLSTIYDFLVGTEFRNCKLGKKYITLHRSFDIDDDFNIVNAQPIDGETQRFLTKNKIKTNGGVALYSTSYKLDITTADKNYILREWGLMKKWLKEYQISSGIDLTEYLDIKLLTN